MNPKANGCGFRASVRRTFANKRGNLFPRDAGAVTEVVFQSPPFPRDVDAITEVIFQSRSLKPSQ